MKHRLEAEKAAHSQINMHRRRVLVTGAAGYIGAFFAEYSHSRYDLRLMVHPEKDGSRVAGFGEVVTAELADLERLKVLCDGIDTVLHLAANASAHATWESLLPNNIIGTYNLFEAAAQAGCRRVVYASSVHAVLGHPRATQVRPSDPVYPRNLYGVSKCFGEALGRYYAESRDLSCIAVRIGGFRDLDRARKDEVREIDTFVSPRDLTHLFHRCIDVEDIDYAIAHGVSNNCVTRIDIQQTRELLGYEPQDDILKINPALTRLLTDGDAADTPST